MAVLALHPSARAFDLVRQYQGDTFFDDWEFYGNWCAYRSLGAYLNI